MSQSEFDGAVEGYREALRAYMTGDPVPVTEFFSRRDDVTLANPLGPPSNRTGGRRPSDRCGSRQPEGRLHTRLRGGVSIQHCGPGLCRPDRADRSAVAG